MNSKTQKKVLERSELLRLADESIVECLKCGYKWISRVKMNGGQRPYRCPKCHRKDWDKPRIFYRIDKKDDF